MRTALLVLLLASSALAQNSSPQFNPQAACGPYATQFLVKVGGAPVQAAPSDDSKALIYVIEDQKYQFLRDVTLRVGLDGNWMGATRGSSYFFFTAEPGEHHLCADWSGHGDSFLGLTVEAGKTYYLRARTTASAGATRDSAPSPFLDFDLVNPDEGRYLILLSTFADSHPKK